MQYSETEEDSERYLMVAEGDSNEWSIGITKVTMDVMLRCKHPCKGDVIALYVFYAYTSRFQKTTTIRADASFVMQALGWGLDRHRKAKNELERLKLIQSVRRTDNTNKVIGWYVKVSYLTEVREYEQKVIKYSDFL